MNKSKRPISAKLGKKMAKAVRNAQTGVQTPEARKYSDELTAKEMLKKFPKKTAKKKEELVSAMTKTVRTKKVKAKKNPSKRTTPGSVPSDSAPASPHREGKRWIKTVTSQTSTQRKIDTRHNRKKQSVKKRG